MQPKKIIYKVTHKESGKTYIGATTKSLEERKADHIQKANNKVGSYFQEAIGTYGPEAFTWELIDTANTSNELARKEQKYVDKFDSFLVGYNQDSGGGIQKEVYQYSIKNGKLLAEYDSLEKAGKALNASRQCISNCCRGQNKTCKGYYWSYIKNDTYRIPEGDKRKKEVIQFSLNGKKLATFDSVSSASNLTGISKTCIARCCRGERKQTHGYKFQYV
ncbi:NUMOD1 domain-containing DNA-binding protein [Robertkochia flava]|uniref:NUMOD1 domain-containing DNA-binding protein n=1 Tax=Robertkochia flava TaxID=3447986 RepID=UPI001CC99A6C|nr:NUMOD1 domain-containing DNA-binding protein [Robertkochia marina]